MTYCEEMDLVSIGFRDGKIQSFFLNIEVDKEDAEPIEDESDSEKDDYENSDLITPLKIHASKNYNSSNLAIMRPSK